MHKVIKKIHGSSNAVEKYTFFFEKRGTKKPLRTCNKLSHVFDCLIQLNAHFD